MISSRFVELERRCKKLKRKRLFKYIVSAFVLLILLVSGYFFSTNSLKQQKKSNIKKVLHKAKVKIEKKPIQQKNILMLQSEVDLDKYSTIKPVTKSTKQIVKKESKKGTLKKDGLPKKVEPGFHINIQNSDKLTVLLKNYTVDKSYKNALAVSIYFFENKNYKKALVWAKKANSIDPSKADPWIIYAKSKYKEGQKKEAINSLETYLRIFNSSKALKLLSKYKGER